MARMICLILFNSVLDEALDEAPASFGQWGNCNRKFTIAKYIEGSGRVVIG